MSRLIAKFYWHAAVYERCQHSSHDQMEPFGVIGLSVLTLSKPERLECSPACRQRDGMAGINAEIGYPPESSLGPSKQALSFD